MKFKILSILMSAFLVFSFAGCNQNENSPEAEAPEESASSEEAAGEVIIPLEIEKANNPEALRNKYETAAAKSVLRDMNGNELNSYDYFDKDRFVSATDDEVFVVEADRTFAYSPETKQVDFFIYIGDSAQEYLKNSQYIIAYAYHPNNNTVISAEEKDGKLYVKETSTTYDPQFKDLASFGFKAEEVKTVTDNYVLDKESYEILEGSSVIETNDGKEYTIYEIERIAEPEVFSVDSEILEKINSEDTRKITIIIDAGTEKEQKIVYDCPKGISMRAMLSEGMDQTVYHDAEYKEPLTEALDNTSDVTIYLRNLS